MREVKVYSNQILHFLAEVISTRKQSKSQISVHAPHFECSFNAVALRGVHGKIPVDGGGISICNILSSLVLLTRRQ